MNRKIKRTIHAVWPHHATMILVPVDTGSSKVLLFPTVPLRLQQWDWITVLNLVQLYSVIRPYTTNETYIDIANCIFQNYAVASKCSRNHFILEKYKTIKLFELIFFTLHLLKNDPLVPIHISTSDCKVDTNIPWSHFIKAFSFFHHVPNDVISIKKRRPFSVLFRSRKQVTISCSQDSREDISVLWHFYLLWNHYQNRPVC